MYSESYGSARTSANGIAVTVSRWVISAAYDNKDLVTVLAAGRYTRGPEVSAIARPVTNTEQGHETRPLN